MLTLLYKPTFSSLSVSWSHIKDTSLEKEGRLQGSRAQHLHIIPYLEKKDRQREDLYMAVVTGKT